MSAAIVMLPMVPVATTAASGTAAGAASNTLKDYMGMFWQSPGTSAQIEYDMGADVVVDTMALLALAGAGSGTLSILYATAAQGNAFGSVGNGVGQFNSLPVGPAYAGANALASGRQAALWIGNPAAPITARWFRVNISGADSGLCRFSRFAIGRRLTLSRNYVFGAQFGIVDFGSTKFSNRGTIIRRRGPKLRTTALRFPYIYKDEYQASVAPLVELAGSDSPILLVIEPDPNAYRTRDIYFGTKTGEQVVTRRNAKTFEWQANLTSLF